MCFFDFTWCYLLLFCYCLFISLFFCFVLFRWWIWIFCQCIITKILSYSMYCSIRLIVSLQYTSFLVLWGPIYKLFALIPRQMESCSERPAYIYVVEIITCASFILFLCLRYQMEINDFLESNFCEEWYTKSSNFKLLHPFSQSYLFKMLCFLQYVFFFFFSNLIYFLLLFNQISGSHSYEHLYLHLLFHLIDLHVCNVLLP